MTDTATRRPVVVINGREVPYAFDVHGNPLTDLLQAVDLHSDVTARTLAEDRVTHPGLGPVWVRTMALVWDHATAVCEPDPAGPRVWGTAYSMGVGHAVEICTYTSYDLAVAWHPHIVDRARRGILTRPDDTERLP